MRIDRLADARDERGGARDAIGSPPSNRLAAVVGGTLLTVAFGGVTVATAMVHAGVPGAVWVVWLTALAWVPGTVTVTLFVPLVFPTGLAVVPGVYETWRDGSF